MPLADSAAEIPRWLEYLREKQFAQRKAAIVRLVLVAKPLLVTSRQQSSSRRAAKGMSHVTAGEPHSVAGQRIDVGCDIILTAIKAHVAVAKVVCQNDDDIGMIY